MWTRHGLLTYYTAFVIELHSRRVHVPGTTTHPDNAFVMQAFRSLAGGSDVLRAGRFLICDRDPKWSRRWRSCFGQSACAWCGRQRRRQTAMRTRSASSGRSRRSASTASSPGRTAPSAPRYEGSSTTIARNESSGHRERADRAATQSTDGWSCAPSSASGWHPQLLLPVGSVNTARLSVRQYGASGSILHGHERVRDGVQAAGRREVG